MQLATAAQRSHYALTPAAALPRCTVPFAAASPQHLLLFNHYRHLRGCATQHARVTLSLQASALHSHTSGIYPLRAGLQAQPNTHTITTSGVRAAAVAAVTTRYAACLRLQATTVVPVLPRRWELPLDVGSTSCSRWARRRRRVLSSAHEQALVCACLGCHSLALAGPCSCRIEHNCDVGARTLSLVSV